MGTERGYRTLPKSRHHLQQYLPKSQEELPVRKMNDSFDSAIIPLRSNLELQEKYITFLGHIRLGRLMEDMDMFAGNFCTSSSWSSVRKFSLVSSLNIHVINKKNKSLSILKIKRNHTSKCLIFISRLVCMMCSGNMPCSAGQDSWPKVLCFCFVHTTGLQIF